MSTLRRERNILRFAIIGFYSAKLIFRELMTARPLPAIIRAIAGIRLDEPQVCANWGALAKSVIFVRAVNY